MSDAGEPLQDLEELQALQDQVDLEKRVVEALQAEYNKALEELKSALKKQAELQVLWDQLDGDAHAFD
jgi:hypothetical protein